MNGVPTGETASPSRHEPGGRDPGRQRNQAGEPEIRHTQHGTLPACRTPPARPHHVLRRGRLPAASRARGLALHAHPSGCAGSTTPPCRAPRPPSPSRDDAAQITSVGRDDSALGLGRFLATGPANAWSSFLTAIPAAPRDAQVAEPAVS
ncbi:hypothetical protein QJS66_03055 [Kocuria rhizophila]|nr:hypothetical protein QJS66_03055 [Kocuria rhizophila]